MKKTIGKKKKRIIAFVLSLLTVLSTVLGNVNYVHAEADGTINFDAGYYIGYGSYSTTRMTFDGGNTAFCVEPDRPTPANGTYIYNLLDQGSSMRKAMYYLIGGYGYDKVTKAQMFSGWSDDDAYVVGHIVLSYMNDGFSGDGDAFMGATQNYIDKAMEFVNALGSLPNLPATFQAFIVPGLGAQAIVGSWYKVPNGWVELQKNSANPGLSDGNENYSLAGAKYGVYLNGNQVATLTTDANGYAKSGDLEEGQYVIKELSAPAGYAVDLQEHNVQIVPEQTTSVNVNEVPKNNPISLVLNKLDAETDLGQAQGNATLENAEFTVKYYTAQSSSDPASAGNTPARTWVFKTDANGQIFMTKDYLVSGDEVYYMADGVTPCVPLGTVTIQETKAPTGYFADPTIFVQTIKDEGTVEAVMAYNTATAEDQIYRGDLEFVKVSDGDLNRLANVPFSITSVTTGESHTIVTDKNGYASTASSWNKHSNHTNEGKTSEDGIWFGSSAVNDSKGALLYDEYVVEEQKCDANKGMNLLKFNVTIYKDAVKVDLGTLTDDHIDIQTTAKDSETESHVSNPDEKVTIIDTVAYEGLKKGQEYKLTGVLMNKATGKAVMVDGKEVTAETIFKAKKTSGELEVSFTFDGSSLKDLLHHIVRNAEE